jgi:hypothetical protein
MSTSTNKPIRQREAKTQKDLSYGWGYVVGIFLVPLGVILPSLRLMDPFLAPLAWGDFVTLMAVCAAFPLAGLGILLKKSFGWYLFFGLIALGVLVFLWTTILPFIAGGFDRILIILGSISLILATLLSLFLLLQVKYWTRRS